MAGLRCERLTDLWVRKGKDEEEIGVGERGEPRMVEKIWFIVDD